MTHLKSAVRSFAVVLVVIASVLVPHRASAQVAPERWPGLRASELQTVYLLDDTGAETEGKLLSLTADSLVLLIDGNEQRFGRERVARLQRRDSLKNGARIGAAIGLALGAFLGGASDCPGDDPGGRCSGFRVAMALSSTGVYASMGLGIDALIRGRSTIYAASSTSQAGRDAVGLLAAASPPRTLLRVGVSW